MVQYQKQTITKKFFFVHRIEILNLSWTELKLIAKSRGIKGYKSMSENIITDQITQGEWKIHSDNIICDHKTQGEWKIHLTIAINFISFKDSNETLTMPIKVII